MCIYTVKPLSTVKPLFTGPLGGDYNTSNNTSNNTRKHPLQTELKKARDDKKFAEDALNKSIEKISEESNFLNDQHEQVNSLN